MGLQRSVASKAETGRAVGASDGASGPEASMETGLRLFQFIVKVPVRA